MSTDTKTRVKLNYARALELLNECVQERGADYIYQDQFGSDCKNYVCTGDPVFPSDTGTRSVPYAGPDTPACIVGLAMSKLLGDEIVKENPVGTVGMFEGYVNMTRKAYALLTHAQQAQDNRSTWGEAVAAGIHWARTLEDEFNLGL